MIIQPVFMYRRSAGGYTVIKAKSHDYIGKWMGWADEIEGIDEQMLEPQIDLIDEVFIFSDGEGHENEQAALRKVAELYKEQLNEQ